MASNTAYETLITKLRQTYRFASVSELLSWDEHVNLPPKSTAQRTAQRAAMAELVHEKSIDPEIGKLLSGLETQSGLTHEQQTVVRETRRQYDRALKLTPEFVAKKSKLQSEAFHAWVSAKEKSDFSLFAPFLKQLIDLAKEESARVGFEDRPYDYWLDQHDPYLTTEGVESLFTPLKKDLVPLVQEILSSPVKASPSRFNGFPVDKQRTFLTEVVGRLGFDFDRGRIDESEHPFCGGNGLDTRMTTHFYEDNPLFSLYSSIHETGHGMYEQGLPADYVGTPLGEHVGMAFHESQSRLWENQVGRSRAFWQHFESRYRELFADQLASVSSEDFYLAINAVEMNPIRIDSDEVTYNLHIILRFEIEKALFSGELSVEELPAVWNKKTQELMGFTPEKDAQGVLQDVHWSIGAFGYFPSYCIGNMIAAQLWYTAKEKIQNLEDQMAQGEFGALLNWLRKEIHVLGKQYNTQDLVKKVTGDELSPKALIQYLKDRYLPLYSKEESLAAVSE